VNTARIWTAFAYLFNTSRIPRGYKQTARSSRHCLQLGVSPLHLVFLVRHDSHARGTRLLGLGATVERCRGIAIFGFPWGPVFRELIERPVEGISCDIVGVMGT